LFQFLCVSVDDAIVTTLPTREGERNRCVFEFARCLKAMPQYAAAQANDLRSELKRWHDQAFPIIGTKSFDETWADFV